MPEDILSQPSITDTASGTHIVNYLHSQLAYSRLPKYLLAFQKSTTGRSHQLEQYFLNAKVNWDRGKGPF